MSLDVVVLGLVGASVVGFGLHLLVRVETDQILRRIIVLGFFAKLTGAVARYTLMADLYGGRGDFNRYLRNGTLLAGQIRSGTLPDQAMETGTPFMDFIVGVMYVFLPNSLSAGFFVFATLSFVGAYLFLQAFRLALPDGNARLYAALVFFTPTMVFWPSSLGKEAWLVFGLGVAAYGAARVLRRARFGYLVVALGGAAVFMVRPHMGALFAVAFTGALLLRFRDPSVRRGIVGWLVGLVAVAIGASYVATSVTEELPVGRGVEEATLDAIAEETLRRTSTGGSEFDSRPVRTPADLVHAAITVPFRPFPTEGHNRQAQLAGLEGVLLLGLILLSLPRLASLPRALLRQPFLVMATAYVVGFIIAFSNVGNFGILTRQRAQLLPFLFVLLAFSQLAPRPERRRQVLVPVTLEEQAASDARTLVDAVPDARSGPLRADAQTSTAEEVELEVELPHGVLRDREPPPR